MQIILANMQIPLLIVSGFVTAIVLFVILGLLLDLVPREPEKPAEPKRESWIRRMFHSGSS